MLNNSLVVCGDSKLGFISMPSVLFPKLSALNVYILDYLNTILNYQQEEFVKPIYNDLVKYTELYKEILEQTKNLNSYNSFPKFLVSEIKPKDYERIQAHDLNSFLSLYDNIQKISLIEEKISIWINKKQKDKAFHNTDIFNRLNQKGTFLAINVRIKDPHVAVRTINDYYVYLCQGMDKYTRGPDRGSIHKEASLALKKWLNKNPEQFKQNINSLIVHSELGIKEIMSVGIFNVCDALTFFDEKMPFRKISKFNVFKEKRENFTQTISSTFELPKSSEVYFLIIEDKNKLPSINYVQLKSGGKFTLLPDFSGATGFTDLSLAQSWLTSILVDKNSDDESTKGAIMKLNLDFEGAKFISSNEDDLSAQLDSSQTKKALQNSLEKPIETKIKKNKI